MTPAKGPIKGISIGVFLGKERRVRYTLATIQTLEAEYKKPILEIWNDVEGPAGAQTKINLLYCGLRHEDPELTAEYIAENVDATEVNQDIGEVMIKALGLRRLPEQPSNQKSPDPPGGSPVQ